jgi:hypothetical protein
MKTLLDCFGRNVRLTDERLAHILEHVEMKGMESEIIRVLREPQLVRQSRSDAMGGCSTSFTRRRLWVANGCALWLSMGRTTRLWIRPT